MANKLQNAGKFNHSNARTPIEGQLINISADYEFFDNGHMLLIKNYIQYGKELIDTANRIDKWVEATLANSPDNIYKDAKMRSSKNLLVAATSHPDLGVYETTVKDSLHACLQLYILRNPFANIVKGDTGYELLKYDVGCQFGEHVDIIPGHAQWGYRKISAIAYLNDDYEGGETTFERQGLSFKPPAGSIVMFPSDFTYPHASQPVKSGIKYSMVTWFA